MSQLPERIGDPIPSPPDYLIAESARLGIVQPFDRPWLPAPWPIGMRSLRMGCMCGGRLSFDRHAFTHPGEKKSFWVWLGQCPKCQLVSWCLEI